MDWKFLVAQLITAGTVIVATMVAQMIKARYKRLGSLGVSQSAKDKLTAIGLASLGLIGVIVPLGASINIAYNVYFYLVKWPNVPVTRSDALLISIWVFYFHVLLVQSVYNLRGLLRLYRENRTVLRAKIEQELEAKHRAELAPLDDAFEKLRETLDKTKDIKLHKDVSRRDR